MKDPASGPFLFDASAERWLAGGRDPDAARWFHEYKLRHVVNVSAVTVLERVRGYALIGQRCPPQQRATIEAARIEYLSKLGTVWPHDARVAVVAGEIMALIPHPSGRRRRSHRAAESRPDRVARWRFDVMIAATALVERMTLIHNNAEDSENHTRRHRTVTPAIPQKRSAGAFVRCNALG